LGESLLSRSCHRNYPKRLIDVVNARYPALPADMV
jgi:hypothetical protein